VVSSSSKSSCYHQLVYQDELKHYTWNPQRMHRSCEDSTEIRRVRQIVEYQPIVEEGHSMQLAVVQVNLA
jgi:hypothetical protein